MTKKKASNIEDIHILVETTGAWQYVGNTPHGRAIIAAAQVAHIAGNDTMQNFIEHSNVSYRYINAPVRTVPDHLKAAGVPDNLIGARIKEIRLLNEKELKNLGWEDSFGERGFVIFLDNGDYLIPSADPEGNHAGAIFTKDSTIC